MNIHLKTHLTPTRTDNNKKNKVERIGGRWRAKQKEGRRRRRREGGKEEEVEIEIEAIVRTFSF